MKRKKLSKHQLLLVWSFIIAIVAIVIIFSRIPIRETLTFFFQGKPTYMVLFMVISFFILVSNAWRWWVVLRAQGHKLPFKTVLAYKYAGYAISFLTPGPRVGGEPVRAGLLAKNKIKFSKGLSSIVIEKSIELSLVSVFFIIGGAILSVNFALPENLKNILIIVAVLVILGVIYFYQQMLRGKEFIMNVLRFLRLDKFKGIIKYEKKIEEFEKHIRTFYRRNKKEFIYCVLITAIGWVLMFFEYKTALLMLGLDVSYLKIFFIFSFVGLAYILPLPLAIGALEASQISIFKIFKLPQAAGVALALLIRARDLLWTIVGLFILSYYGINYANNNKKCTPRQS